MINSKCKICRRLGVKLFLKGERCFSPKCAMIKKPYSPGLKGKKRKSPPSEYSKQLREKQKLKLFYNLQEKQFKNYVKEILSKKGKIEDASAALIKLLESRLDNVVFRLGFATSRTQARKLVSHGYFLVNGRTINIPAYQVRKGDVVSIKPTKRKKKVFQDLKKLLEKQKIFPWLELNIEKLDGKVVGEPSLSEVAPAVEISTIFEYYSR